MGLYSWLDQNIAKASILYRAVIKYNIFSNFIQVFYVSLQKFSWETRYQFRQTKIYYVFFLYHENCVTNVHHNSDTD